MSDPKITTTQNSSENNVFTFEVIDLPALTTTNNTQSFYEYFWDFGDGYFSTKPRPTHTYPATEANYTAKVRVRKANQTLTGGSNMSPMSESIAVALTGGDFVDQPDYSTLLSASDLVGMKIIAPPAKGQQVCCLISYHNPDSNAISSGSIHLRFNPTSEGETILTFNQESVFHGESVISDTPPSGSGYANEVKVEFSNLTVGQYRNLCLVFDVSAELGPINNTQVQISITDNNGNSKGSSILNLPIVTMYSPMEMIIAENSTVPA